MAKKEEKKSEVLYSKEQILSSLKFREHVDLANALLSDDKRYTLVDVENMINNYLKGTVN